MREDGCSCVLAPKELQLAGYSLCLRPTREPSRSYGNHYYTASFFANPLEVIGPHFRGQVFSSLEKKRRHRLKQYISKTATICIYILHMYLPNYVSKIMRILVLCIDYILFLEIKYSSTYLCRYLAFCSQIS